MRAATTGRVTTRRSAAGSAGFTLIELLAVLAILGLLMGLAVFFFGKQKEQGYKAKTKATMAELELLITRYSAKLGDFPPDNLAVLKIRSENTLNEGAEALFAALHNKSFPEGTNVSESNLGNSDQDFTATVYHRDAGVTGLLEVIDGWKNPIAYFTQSGYGRECRYVLEEPLDPSDAEQSVSAQKSKITGAWANADSFQLISAGSDQKFGTEDDVTNFGH